MQHAFGGETAQLSANFWADSGADSVVVYAQPCLKDLQGEKPIGAL